MFRGRRRYSLLEPLLAARVAAMRAAASHEGEVGWLTRTAAAARAAGDCGAGLARIDEIRVAVAEAAAGGGAAESSALAGWREEEARLLWADGRWQAAAALAERLAAEMEAGQAARAGRGAAVLRLRAAALRAQLGEWMAESRAESGDRITAHFAAALAKLEPDLSGPAAARAPAELRRTACRTYYAMARFEDAQYRSAEARIESGELREMQRLLRAHEAEAEALRVAHDEAVLRKSSAHVELGRRLASLRTSAANLSAMVRHLQSEGPRALAQAVAHYAAALRAGDAFDVPAMFRMAALWLRHAERVPAVNAGMHAAAAEGAASSVPSFKFLPLAWQLVSRLGKSSAAAAAAAAAAADDASSQPSFQAVLTSLVERLAEQHPHHTLWQLLALENSSAPAPGKRAGVAYRAEEERAAVVRVLLGRLGGDNKERLKQMRQLASAYVAICADAPAAAAGARTTLAELAGKHYAVVKQGASQARKATAWLLPVPTEPLAADPTAQYAGLPLLSHLDNDVAVMSGVTRPRKVVAVDTHGRRRAQVVKPKDDLRQDAVMQQVFTHVNALLRQDAGTRERRLRMMTFKVVPLTPFEGLLQWAPDTEPLSAYLFGGATGAHARHGAPGDIEYGAARVRMDAVVKAAGGALARDPAVRAEYDAICAAFRPVMHHFFLERYSGAAEWFQRRLAYTRSVAVSSMVGYVTGLGDRHCSNILINTLTGELVHIDLGIAFEQGHMLTYPELVPFRLTRDIVDGMGAAGVEGVMRRCCEATARVLRQSKESLLTIVDVLVHDPIIKWTLTPAAAARRQGADGGGGGGGGSVSVAPGGTLVAGGGTEAEADGAPEGNADAQRVLLRVRQKLEGHEDGDVRSVEGQVQHLIAAARDPALLARMYSGWGAWA